MTSVNENADFSRIEPSWDKKFNTCIVREIAKQLTDEAFKDFDYHPDDNQTNAEKINGLAAQIRDKVQREGYSKEEKKVDKEKDKEGAPPRYKIFVEGFLGEKKNQRVTISAKGWWDIYVDNYVSYTYDAEKYFCTVIVWGFYTD